jgi:uncharacterized membrane protein YfcA
MGTTRRAAWLVACILAGIAVGVAVRAATGSAAGFLAVPVLVALAWLAVADPTRCAPRGADATLRARAAPDGD